MISLQRPRLGEILVRSGKLTQAQVSEGLFEQSSQEDGAAPERLGRCLVRLGHISEGELHEVLAEQLGLERVDLKRVAIGADARSILPLDFVRKNRILPLELRGSTIVVATADPGDDRTLEDIRLLSGLEVREVLAPLRAITEKIAESFDITVARLLEEIHSDGAGGETGSAAGSDTLHEIEVMASEPAVVNLVNVIISSALKERASDIHIVPFEKATELRYRIDGVLHDIPPPPKRLHAALISRVKIMSELDIAERFVPQDGHFQIQHAGRRVDVRVGTMPTIHGESVVLRLLEKDSQISSLRELGLDEDRCKVLDELLQKPHGIFLATGPTGSGKTTTLYSVLNGIYSKERKILTLEDPVEYELPGVTQIPIKPARGFTFAAGLRSILRQDPDVIMVGEIRDAETAEIAIRAALTGHLVFSTLHTNDAAGAIARLLDMRIEPFLIASSLEAVLAQRLVRRICSECKEPARIDAELERGLRVLGAPGDAVYYHGRGCDACRHTGYRGRTALYEILVLEPALRDLVLARRPSTEIKAAALRRMTTIRQAGVAKAAEGSTSVAEILRVTMADAAGE